MDDEKAVALMAAAIAKSFGFDAWQCEDEARAALAAIRAAGGEVAWWRPISEGASIPEDVNEYYWNDDRGRATHFAILRGPEVKP